VDPSDWVVPGIGLVGTLVLAFFGYKQVKAQAKPGAQDAINAGFTALSDRQTEEIQDLRNRVAQAERTSRSAEQTAEHAEDEAAAARHQAETAKRQIAKLAGHVEKTTQWHVRHLPFDQKAKTILEEVAPDRLGTLPKLEPFPKYEHIEDME
jgi:hypothetical protein